MLARHGLLYALTKARRTPENEAGFFDSLGKIGIGAIPKLIFAFVKSAIFQGPGIIIGAFPSVKDELQKSPLTSAAGTSSIFSVSFENILNQ